MSNLMPESSGSIENLLAELIELQKVANAQQLRAIESAEAYQAETRQRVEASIRLQEVSVQRQRTMSRLVTPIIVVVIILVAIVVVGMFH